MQTQTHTHAHTHTDSQFQRHSSTFRHTQTHFHTETHTCTHTTRTNTHMQTHTHTHTHYIIQQRVIHIAFACLFYSKNYSGSKETHFYLSVCVYVMFWLSRSSEVCVVLLLFALKGTSVSDITHLCINLKCMFLMKARGIINTAKGRCAGPLHASPLQGPGSSWGPSLTVYVSSVSHAFIETEVMSHSKYVARYRHNNYRQIRGGSFNSHNTQNYTERRSRRDRNTHLCEKGREQLVLFYAQCLM